MHHRIFRLTRDRQEKQQFASISALLLTFMLSLTACSSDQATHCAPVVNLNKNNKTVAQKYISPRTPYVSKKGDSVFTIAKQSGQDPQRIAVLNGIKPPYKVKAGQKIVFSEKMFKANKNNKNMNNKNNMNMNMNKKMNMNKTVNLNTQNKSRDNNQIRNLTGSTAMSSSNSNQNVAGGLPTAQNQYKTFTGNSANPKKTAQRGLETSTTSAKSLSHPPQKLVQKTLPEKVNPETKSASANINWHWPVRGKIIRPFQDKGKGKGIDIAGTLGKPIKAAAGGVVVYSGNALKGYGNLIIIKHNEDFLSAYAHNRELRVKEGERVQTGQEIALMGQTDAEQVKVHFEIRYKGKPVNPLKFLPGG